MYPVLLADTARNGYITEDEASEAYEWHKLIERARDGQSS
jgi:hypothetical protein